MSSRAPQGVREVLARFALELDGINDRFADHEQQRSDALSTHEPARPTVPLSTDDLDVLLNAIKARLRRAVDETQIGQYNGAAAPLRVTVLECVDALDHLQSILLDAGTRQPGAALNAPSEPAVTARAEAVVGSVAPSAAPPAVAAAPPPAKRA